MALTERHVIQEVKGKVLADVAGTVASLGFYVVEVLGVGRETPRIFYIVNRVAEGVVCLEAQTSLARTAIKGELQSVVRAEPRVGLERDVAEVRVRTSAERWIEVVDALFAPQINAMVADVGDLERHILRELIRDTQVPLIRVDVRLVPREAVYVRWRRRGCLREKRIIGIGQVRNLLL